MTNPVNPGNTAEVGKNQGATKGRGKAVGKIFISYRREDSATFFVTYQAACSAGDIATEGDFKGGPANVLLSGPVADHNYSTWDISTGSSFTAYAVCTQFQRGG